MSRDKNIIQMLWDEASEGDFLSFWKWFAIFLLFCSYLGIGGFWGGLQGRQCSAWGNTLEQQVFASARRGGCFVRGVFEVVFPQPKPQPKRPVVRPRR